ncbi:unnamed protein product [Adineta ricciae]|nr:unnamed protein product [Adineta ricciae]
MSSQGFFCSRCGESFSIRNEHLCRGVDKGKFDCLYDKAGHVQEKLSEKYYQSEVNHVVENLKFNILIIGSPRVGKSQLINALTNGNGKAETSQSLNSCTKEIQPFALNIKPRENSSSKQIKITFYDTPGIEDWNNNGGVTSMTDFIQKTDPICIIYCASPGSFAKLNQLHSILEYCKSKSIFCALVCTNMWSGMQRHVVIEEFQKELVFFGEKIDKYSNQIHSPHHPHKVTFFGDGALCTMVNSIEYHDPELSDLRKPVQGIDELIHSIMETLDQEKLLGWCYAVLYRRTYWERISQKVGGFFTLRIADLKNLVMSSPSETAENFLVYLKQRFLKEKVV